jgi:hypothetical protein
MANDSDEPLVTHEIDVYLYPDLQSKAKGTDRAGTPVYKLGAATVPYSLPPTLTVGIIQSTFTEGVL